MFLFTQSRRRCPNCGAAGVLLKGMKGVRKCDCCNAVYSEFAILSEGERQEMEPS